MKTPTAFLLLTLSLVVGGCIDTKDVGVESDASSGGSAGEGSAGSMTSGASESGSSGSASSGTTASGTATATESGTATATTQTGGETGVVTMATATASDSDTDTFGGSESSTGSDTDGGGEQALCEDSGGAWDVKSCGHYTCGLGPDCDAIVPGCNCGVGSSFVEGSGCEPSEDCEGVEFACGPELTCSAPSQFCDVFFPGVKGADVSYNCQPTPETCADAYTCACIDTDIMADECEEGPEGGVTISLVGA